MTTKSLEIEFNRRNSSDNFSQAINSTSREYVFAPVNYRDKLMIFTAMLLVFGVYGLIANSLILYLKNKQHRRRRSQRGTSRTLTEYFINSLALTDLLCCLISFPVFTTEMFIDFVKSDSICRLNRLINTCFPVITIINLLVIGIERYLAIFHPYYLLRRRKAKKMVVGAWVLGILITLAFIPSLRLVYESVGDNYYTFVCKYDSSVSLYRAIFTSFKFIVYFLPSFTLTFINLRILKRQRLSKRVAASQTTQRALSRLKVTRMFVSLIFAFVIPYTAFFVSFSFRAVFKRNVSFTADYIVRHVNIFLVYANGSVSATILIYYEKLYLELLSCFRPRSTTNNRNKTVQRQASVNKVNDIKDRITPI